MIYKSIAIIGLGTLGGFVAEAISRLDNTENLIIIDHDIVESENLKDTIYRQIDIGLLKTDALYDILKNRYDLSITKISERFVENETIIPDTDLILDCRNYTYDRKGQIDARLYISSRYLIVDCRRKVEYKIRQKGKYITQLSKDDLRSASQVVSILINGNTLQTLVKDQAIQKYEIDCFSEHNGSCYDIVYEGVLGGDRFVNLPEKIMPIIDLNKNENLNIVVGSRATPTLETLIPVNSLRNSRDVVETLATLTNQQQEFNHYVVAVFKEKNNTIIELIPETGAA